MEVPEDLDVFCRHQYPRLVGALSLYCGDPDLAEELAQEALERACERWPHLVAMASPGAWVHRVGMNLAHSRYRRRQAERRARARHAPTEDRYEETDVAERLTLRSELLKLSKRQRTVLVMRYYLGFSVAETAEALGVTDGAVKAATHRGVTRLRSKVESVSGEEVIDVN